MSALSSRSGTPHPGRRSRRVAACGLAVLPLALLAGCAYPPPDAPSFTALPGRGKPYAQFQREDAFCRSNGYAAAGGPTGTQNAVANGVGTAALGTVAGAAAGALIGAAAGNAGAGAAIGGGTGLAFGGLYGASNTDRSYYELQRRYDQVYAQCMVAYGNLVPVPQPVAAYPGPGYGPAVGFGVGF